MTGADAPSPDIERDFKEHLAQLTKDTIRKYYTAQYKAALLGLIQFSGKTPDDLQDEVISWLHYHVDNFNDPLKRVPTSTTPLLCIYGIDTLPCDECKSGNKDNKLAPCNQCHHGKSCMFEQKEAEA